MTRLPIGEVFGRAADDRSAEAGAVRARAWCPFRDLRCNKVSADEPLGICGYSSGNYLTTVCPNRFLENQRIFRDAGRLAFGEGSRIVIAPERRILRVEGLKNKKIGKVDYLIAKIGDDDTLVDFAAIEVQSVYISGYSIKSAFKEYMQTGALGESAYSRMDWRSSGQKRLMPQLSLKVPVFRRWGKKFFVAVDASFFRNIPDFKKADSISNSEVTWLVYPFSRNLPRETYRIGEPTIYFSEWGDIESALREGKPPSPEEVLKDIQDARSHSNQMIV